MVMYRTISAGTLILFALLQSACVGNITYRTDYKLCVSANPEADCKQSSIQEYSNPQKPDEEYLLGFVEFDDQGQLHDRAQMNMLINTLNTLASRENLLMVVFVHGWHHNARPDDENITHFRKSLLEISRLENINSTMEKRRTRKTVGIYVGWRGESLSIPGVNVLTFYGRKNSAETVGHGGVTELFSQLEDIKKTKAAINAQDNKHADSQNRLIIIGHSFGGAVVYSAVSQLLMDRFVETKGPAGTRSTINSIGDLVVLINPAFEAARFSSLSDMANERRTYFDDQLPVMVVLTSETDYATKYAFWAGRFFSTLFENDRKIARFNYGNNQEQTIKQGSANRIAIGHFEPYRTHTLVPDSTSAMLSNKQSIETVQQGWQNDQTHGEIKFPGTVLRHLDNSVKQNPYLIINVDTHIIPGHNEIYDPRVLAFLSHLIMLSTQAQ